MPNTQDKFDHFFDFEGGGTVSTVGQGDRWAITDTSAAGTPTYVHVDGAAAPGEVAIDFDSQAEAQNVCFSFSDVLCYDIDLIDGFEWRVKMNQAAADATTMIALGMTGDRNDAIDSIAQALLFRVVGADSTTAVVVESDDGTNENNDVATGQTLINVYKRVRCVFGMTPGVARTAAVQFFMDDANGALRRVASSTTFNMSSYTGALQPFAQIQKTSDANTDGFTVDYFHIWGNRA